MPKFIDISIPIENDVRSDPAGYEPKIEYLNHHDTTGELMSLFPVKIKAASAGWTRAVAIIE